MLTNTALPEHAYASAENMARELRAIVWPQGDAGNTVLICPLCLACVAREAIAGRYIDGRMAHIEYHVGMMFRDER